MATGSVSPESGHSFPQQQLNAVLTKPAGMCFAFSQKCQHKEGVHLWVWILKVLDQGGFVVTLNSAEFINGSTFIREPGLNGFAGIATRNSNLYLLHLFLCSVAYLCPTAPRGQVLFVFGAVFPSNSITIDIWYTLKFFVKGISKLSY